MTRVSNEDGQHLAAIDLEQGPKTSSKSWAKEKNGDWVKSPREQNNEAGRTEKKAVGAGVLSELYEPNLAQNECGIGEKIKKPE